MNQSYTGFRSAEQERRCRSRIEKEEIIGPEVYASVGVTEDDNFGSWKFSSQPFSVIITLEGFTGKTKFLSKKSEFPGMTMDQTDFGLTNIECKFHWQVG